MKIETMDGVVIAVTDAAAAAKTYETLFGAKVVRERHSDLLAADITSLGCGTDLIRLAQPTGDGPVRDHLDRWGDGLFAAVFSSKDPGAVASHLDDVGVGYATEHDHVVLDPGQTYGLRTIVSPFVEREPVGLVSFLYEVTHLVSDWQAASDFWTKTFALDGARFSPISSEQYGYDGMLTLFDPPRLLDRIEVVHPHDRSKAMGTFFDKRGEGPYMFFCECSDMGALASRLRDADVRFAPHREEAPPSLFVHPSSTHGVLIGVSGPKVAWVWSGRPELAPA